MASKGTVAVNDGTTAPTGWKISRFSAASNLNNDHVTCK